MDRFDLVKIQITKVYNEGEIPIKEGEYYWTIRDNNSASENDLNSAVFFKYGIINRGVDAKFVIDTIAKYNEYDTIPYGDWITWYYLADFYCREV